MAAHKASHVTGTSPGPEVRKRNVQGAGNGTVVTKPVEIVDDKKLRKVRIVLTLHPLLRLGYLG
jgi:hypothetical protein